MALKKKIKKQREALGDKVRLNILARYLTNQNGGIEQPSGIIALHTVYTANSLQSFLYLISLWYEVVTV